MQYLLTQEEFEDYIRLKQLTPEREKLNKKAITEALGKVAQDIFTKTAQVDGVFNREKTRNICAPLYNELKKQGLI